jgi:hypothetical protein
MAANEIPAVVTDRQGSRSGMANTQQPALEAATESARVASSVRLARSLIVLVTMAAD